MGYCFLYVIGEPVGTIRIPSDVLHQKIVIFIEEAAEGKHSAFSVTIFLEFQSVESIAGVIFPCPTFTQSLTLNLPLFLRNRDPCLLTWSRQGSLEVLRIGTNQFMAEQAIQIPSDITTMSRHLVPASLCVAYVPLNSKLSHTVDLCLVSELRAVTIQVSLSRL